MKINFLQKFINEARPTFIQRDDEYCVPTLYDAADEVHVSVAFTWDIPLAERLAQQWKAVAQRRVDGQHIRYNEQNLIQKSKNRSADGELSVMLIFNTI